MRLATPVLTCLLILSAPLLHAWGPHPEITQAALDAIGPEDALVKKLGTDAPRLTQYVWMADQRQQLLTRKDEVFYSDDFLLFPAASKHYDHLCPEVKQTYVPYFRRALQALRTESSLNAARWIGSLLHFTTDTGSPPHAAEIRGTVHSHMENWVQGKLIHSPGYKPQLLGTNDAEAEAGFLKRMDGLISYCKERAERCRADVEQGRRELVEPVVLEAALETARVTADLLHTLGHLASGATPASGISGKVITEKRADGPLARLPVKIILTGTLYSTLADADGTFAFTGLPAGEYTLVASTTGITSAPQPVEVSESQVTIVPPLDLSAPVIPGNLIRNPAFALRWVSPASFDHWTQPLRPGRLRTAEPVNEWIGEWIPVKEGTTCRLAARWKTAALAGNGFQVILKGKGKREPTAFTFEWASLVPGREETTFSPTPDISAVQVWIRGSLPPSEALEFVSLSATVTP